MSGALARAYVSFWGRVYLDSSGVHCTEYGSRIRAWYTGCVLDETTFRRHADTALESLRKALIQAESEADFEVEERNGVLAITFDEPAASFTLTPNIPVRQISVSALSSNFQLDWDPALKEFVLAKTGESLKSLVARLMREHLGGHEISLD